MKASFQFRNRLILIGDLILISTSILASFALRLELGPLFIEFVPQAFLMMGLALIVKPIIYQLFGLYRRYWVYASTRELLLVASATTTASVVVAAIVMLGIASGILPAAFPRAVLGIDWLLSVLSVGGLRMTIRLLAESGQMSQKADGFAGGVRIVVVGAGDAGVLVVREMQRNPQLHLLPVAFVDDDPEKLGKEIHGVSIAGALPDLASVVNRFNAHEVVIAIPTAPGAVVRLVTDICSRHQIPFKTMPGMYELIGGKVSVNRLREVNIADLLRREPAHINDEMISEKITGKRVMVTGAGGSIGLELCRQTARWRPAQLALLGHGENSIFEALLDLTEDFPGLPIIPIIADIRDRERILSIFDDFRPEFIFHAAAHKHVPLMEVNVEEAVTNNVIGTKNIVDAAVMYETERLVMVSTDKAVEPKSVYGATKRMAEIIVRDAAYRIGRPYVVVRFGNVLGSRGSIVPIFKRQISRGGPVTVTDPEMKRFFMTIPEAVHLVLQASAMGTGGEFYMFGRGEQVRILELAEDLIRLSGLEPYKDIEIVFTGIRAGEKLSEALWDDGMKFEPTDHADILKVEEELPFEGDQLQATIGELMRLALEGDAQALIGLLSERVPGSLIRQTPPPDYTSVL